MHRTSKRGASKSEKAIIKAEGKQKQITKRKDKRDVTKILIQKHEVCFESNT